MRKETSIGVLHIDDTLFNILKVIPKSGFFNRLFRKNLYVVSEFTHYGNKCPVIIDLDEFSNVSIFMLKVPCEVLVQERTKNDPQYYGDH